MKYSSEGESEEEPDDAALNTTTFFKCEKIHGVAEDLWKYFVLYVDKYSTKTNRKYYNIDGLYELLKFLATNERNDPLLKELMITANCERKNITYSDNAYRYNCTLLVNIFQHIPTFSKR